MIGSGTDMNWVNSIAPSSIDGGGGGRACTNLKRVETERETGLGRYFSTGQCFTDGEYRGGGRRPASISGNYFQEWVMAVPKYGLRLADNHVAGDRTVTNLLNMMEEMAKKYGPNATKNWTFDPCTMMNPKDIPRAVRLGLIFSCTAGKVVRAGEGAAGGSGGIAEVYAEQVAHTFSKPVKSIIDAGGKVAYNSGTYGYVWEGLEWFVMRKDADGKVWGPQERLDRPTALKTATRWNADYVLKGDKLGSIESGKLADMVVIDKDFLTIPPEEIHTIQAQLTIFDGRIVFVHTNFANEYNLRPQGAVISTRQELEARRPRDQKGGRTGNDGLR